MNHDLSPQLASRVAADLAELAERISVASHEDGAIEPQPGVFFYRKSQPGERVHSVCEPAFCLMAQGSKVVLLGDETFRYDPARYLITTMQLPVTGEVVEASPERPYLGFRLTLDPAIVTSVMVESGLVDARSDGSAKAVDVGPLDPDLLNATLRLVRLVDKPSEYRVLGPLVIREIVYRLLTGAQGNRLRHLAMLGGQSHRMVRAVEIIRDNFDKPLKIEAVAKELYMSVSGFHAHFKAVTAMSPLQYQKQLRLQEARRLMLNENLDAAQAGYRVGYDDASHFSRDYKRNYGEPPIRNIERLRELSEAISD
ncbi:AraC family transcriptional regulator [Lacipirellula parvula]|uniref:Transcriptional regulator n=1 Tax=Lacipirellula parvula TaxID=2650471 RepID=A0A5K7X7U7_9BACT|nr:AraC family transcriptional regulator [Lacipirellula parvula]BBO31932.1 transcriptional regulator [Lacipirellula parvula]